MLTKELLKYRVRGERIYPLQIPHDPPILEWAATLADRCRTSIGTSVTSLDALLDEDSEDHLKYHRVFKKLLMDRITWQEGGAQQAATRREVLETAQNLRCESAIVDVTELRRLVSERTGVALPNDYNLYADLPEFRCMESFESIESETLVHRSNCAQVQGLLLRCRQLKLTIPELSLAHRRHLLRWIKFLGLVVTPDLEAEGLALTLDGPMSMFQSSHSYGAKFAQFFPHILHVPKWSLSAEIEIPERYGARKLKLSLNESSGVKGHAQGPTGYVPEEFDHFLSSFQKAQSGWEVEPCAELLHLGDNHHCFPDFRFVGPEKQTVYLELFHKWHYHQLEDRLKAVTEQKKLCIIAGVDRAVCKNAKVKDKLATDEWFQRYGFEFRSFPTAKKVLTVIGALGDCGRINTVDSPSDTR